MFRLKLASYDETDLRYSIFKLHYVQIKTTMTDIDISTSVRFKLHYVQIKTTQNIADMLENEQFKLHYVQIETNINAIF